MKHVPPSTLAGAWLEMKQVEFADNTALPPKYKALISIAVASQIPCRYCLYTDRASARMYGATDAEIDEAIAIAADTRHWSTLFHGLQVDRKQFDREIQQMLKVLAKQLQAAKDK